MAISFAGEDRAIAKDLVEALSKKGVEVFYDESFKSDLLGRKLADDFRDIYGSLILQHHFRIVCSFPKSPAHDVHLLHSLNSLYISFLTT